MENDRQVEVRLFGDFGVFLNGTEISGQIGHSKKLRSFAQYLLMHQSRTVPSQELYEVLWPNEGSSNPRNALKTLTHRFRALLLQGGAPADMEFLIVRQGAYQWNPALKSRIDAVEFEDIFKRVQAGSLSRADQIAMLRRAVGLYRGRYMDDSEMWMMGPSAYYHSAYLRMVSRLCSLLREEGLSEDIAQICDTALRIDELDESLNREIILALIACGRNKEAMERYNNVTELYYNRLGVQISDELREMYRQIVEAEHAMDLDVDSVRGKLEEKDATNGAFLCEYSIFKDLYRIEARCLDRYGGRVFLGLLTVTNAYMEAPEPRVLNRAMDQLVDVARRMLRKGDIIARYSPGQYVMLLPTVTYETGQMVLERIQKSFRREYPKSPVVVSYKLRPLRPPVDE